MKGGLLTGAATINSGATLINGTNPLYLFGGGMTINSGGTLSAGASGSIELADCS